MNLVRKHFKGKCSYHCKNFSICKVMITLEINNFQKTRNIKLNSLNLKMCINSRIFIIYFKFRFYSLFKITNEILSFFLELHTEN